MTSTAVPTYEFGVSEFTTQPWTFEQDVEQYSHLGVDTIEVCEVKLDRSRLDEELALIGQRGLRVSSVQPSVRTLFPSLSQPYPVVVAERMKRFRQTIQDFGAVAHGVPFITNSGIPPGGDARHVLEVAVVEYRNLSDYAAEFGARIAFEPLNPTIMNVESTIWTIEQGMAIVDRVDRQNFGLCIDFWNIWQNPNVVEAIMACADRNFIVQVSDWRMPRSYQDRLVPGKGEIPLAILMRATYQSGYRGPYEVEIFSGGVDDSLWEGDLRQVIRDSREGMDRAWREAL
jgi:sugar phosphate isomerase/epimerase